MANKKQERVNVDLMTVTGLGKALAAIGVKGAGKAKTTVSKAVKSVVKSAADKVHAKKAPIERKTAKSKGGALPPKGKNGKKDPPKKGKP